MCKTLFKQKRFTNKGLAGLIVFLVFLSVYENSFSAQIKIKIYADQDLGPRNLLQGFLHGFDDASFNTKNYSSDHLSKLNPKFWRIGINSSASHYLIAKDINPNVMITLVFSDIYADILKGVGYRKVKPWEDWKTYEKDVRFIVKKILDAGMHIDYWDLWSEPDDKNMWPGTCDQLFELFKRTHNVIRSIDLTAKIVGPSISRFDIGGTCPEPFLGNFLLYIEKQNLHFDAISWHEFEYPEEVPVNVDLVRKFFKEHPSLGTPEIHINEYAGPLDHLIPGWVVGWLYYLEKADVDWASRACWDIKEGFFSPVWSTCNAGLNGLFLKGNKKTQHVYWVHRAYAEMNGKRLKSTSSASRTVALASRDDQTREIKVLAGRYDIKGKKGPSADVEIEIINYPYPGTAVYTQIQRIPNENIPGSFQNGPIIVSNSILSLKNATINIPLGTFGDGDAYLIVLKPKE